MMKILTVVGARPQFVKASAVSRAIRNVEHSTEVLVHTGQHHDAEMSEVFFQDLELPNPAYNLGIHGGSHGQMTGRMLAELDPIITREKPDWVLVYGDTNSTLAGALAASKLNVPVAHVEAGLRSFNRRMPEEINRVMTDHVSTLLFCPTPVSVDNLRREGVEKGVSEVGDVMLDVAQWAKTRLRNHDLFSQLGIPSSNFVLLTIHRAENVDIPEQASRLREAVENLASDHPVVWPVHPRTRILAEQIKRNANNLHLIEPIGFLEMCTLLDACDEVYTDSGGLQKEAYFFGKPCTTLRNETEWVETIDCGWNRLWPSSPYLPRREITVYGTGDAAEHIVKGLMSFDV